MVKSNEIEVLDPKKVTNSNQNVPPIKQEIRKYLDKETILEVINNLPQGIAKMLIIVLWMTGLRVSELNSIRKKDIDIKNKIMRVRWLKSRKYNERIIPIKTELAYILEIYVSTKNSDDLIFPVTRQYIYRVVSRHFPGYSPHTLRHSFAVNFLRQSTNPTALVILQRLLGHSKIQTTLEYLRIVPSDMAKALAEVSFD